MDRRALAALALASAFALGGAYAQSPARTAALAEHQGKRYALVIGNTFYEPPIESLVNPKKDARDMCATLRRVGFEAQCFENVKTRREMEEKVDAFTEKLKKGGVGLFYYAGHGAQYKGVNYLLPSTAVLKRERDLEYETMSLNYLMTALQEAGNDFNMVILDACRTNPLPPKTRSADASRGGLASVKGPVGTFIAFATAEGDVSYDGPLNGNGMFTRHILANLEKPGLKIEDVFKRVTQGVMDDTSTMDRGPQVPWIAASIRGEFCFVSCKDPGVEELLAALRREKDAEVERLRVEKDLVEKQKRLMELELGKRSQSDAELKKLRDEKAALEAEKKRLETTVARGASSAKSAPARVQLSAEEQAQVEKLRGELAMLTEERNKVEMARAELGKLQEEKSKIERDLKASQERLRQANEEERTSGEKKKVFVPPTF